ncbi:MAG: TetR/AcrR family transcriptional regulator [Ruminococcaceae bacterium]|nr:TetR/AcrR family transcriptional regulator [Oscillospiraceae bacterium]
MNSSYYKLPPDKQNNLINAGFKVFSLYPYKKGSMSFVAREAAISKSLMFYYFKNKKEYYLYLFDMAIQFLSDRKEERICGEKNDLFQLVNREIERRLQAMHDYPYLLQFVAKAYYESEEEIKSELEIRKKTLTWIGKENILKLIDYEPFQNPPDAKELIDIILFIAEGCMRGREEFSNAKIREILPVFQDMMSSLKNHYYK